MTIAGHPSLSLAPIEVNRDTCQDYARSSKLEWLETNGTGSYAMGTVSGAHTRRYHGLLVASLHPPASRHVVLSKVDESIVDDLRNVYPLATNQYPGTLYPEGFRRLVGFRLQPFPLWSYRTGNFDVEKRLLLVPGEPTVVIEYQSQERCRLRVEPLVAYRDFHALGKRDDRFDSPIAVQSRSVRMRPERGPFALTIHHSAGTFEANADWHYDVEYLEERERGFDFREDLFRPGTLDLELGPGRPAWIVATLAGDERREDSDETVRSAFQGETMRRRSSFPDPFVANLDRAADAFIVTRREGSPSVIAGYPWFADWGRDAMIAVPGLLLARGRVQVAEDLIRGFLAHMEGGVIPNRFADDGKSAEYNTVDATLWMFHAVNACLAETKDDSFARHEFYPRGREILRIYREGTHHAIRIDARDGLLSAGDVGTQLTWMDAKIGDEVITPRHGKPVEVNALYYNALCFMASWAHRFGHDDDAHAFDTASAKVASAFAATFWNARQGCLYDVARSEGPDARIRPNQIFALSLPHPLMTPTQRLSILSVVTDQLLTPAGLRTLSPKDPDYRPHYLGDTRARDAAYHQGIVWPWLLGPYVRAYLNVFGRTPDRVAHCRGLVRQFERHLREACLGTISEIFEAEPPFRPAGAPAQAWSVAELLALSVFELA